MTEDRLVRELGLLGDLVEIEGKPNCKWRSAAFRVAAKKIRTGKSIYNPAPQNNVEEEVATAVTQLRANGSCKLFQRLTVPLTVAEFLQVPGINVEIARQLYEDELESLGDLEDAINEGSFTDPQVIAALRSYRNVEVDLFPHHKLRKMALKLLELLEGFGVNVEIVGSLRRWKPAVRNIDMLCILENPQQKMHVMDVLADHFSAHPHCQQDVIQAVLDSAFAGIGLRLFLTQPKALGATKLYATGSRDHLTLLRQRLAERHLLLIKTGVFRNGHLIAGHKEREIYACAGLPYHPPELREWGLIEKEVLLVEKHAIDLHVHTSFGIGTASVDQAIRQAIQTQLEAVAICDRYSKIPNFNNYVKAVQQAKQRYASFIKVFCSVEAEIDYQGKIAVPNHPALDYITASLIETPQLNTQGRLIRAMREYPRIKLLAHPVGRQVAKSHIPIEADWEDVFRTAGTLGVALQINSAPRKIDLPARLARFAKRFGCKFSIDSDARYLSEIGNLLYGVKCAQRAVLSPIDIVDLITVEGWCAHEKKK